MVRVVPGLLVAALLGVAQFVLGALETARAAEPLKREDVQRLFEYAWSADADERAKAAEYYDELVRRCEPDQRIAYARVLTAIKQRQFADALKYVEPLVSVNKPLPGALRAKVWLAVLLKNYGQAAIASEKLVAALPPLSDPPAEDETDQEDLARFLGRVQGFLDGPAADAWPEGQRTGLRKKMVDALKGERKVAYLEGRDAVLEQYLALTDEKESRREKSKEDGERERDEKLTALNETREQAAQRKKDLEARASKLRGELNDELAQLAKQDAPLQRRFAQLDVQGTALRRELSLIDADRVRLEALVARERDPNLRALYVRDLARLDTTFARLEIDLATITRQAAGVAAQRGDLDRRAAQARASLGQQIDLAESENADLNRKVKRADTEERRLKTRNPRESSGAVTAKAAQAAAFTTYEPFPLDDQRQALLDSFK